MDQKPDECPEPDDDSVTPIPEDESMASSDIETLSREELPGNPDLSTANTKRPHKEQLWHESCIPGKPPGLSVSVVLGLLLGVAIVSMFSKLLSEKSPPTPQASLELTDSDATQKAQDSSNNANPDAVDPADDSSDDFAFTSEVGMDRREQKRAEACRIKI